MFRYGYEFMKSGNYVYAVESIEKGLQSDPDNTNALINLGAAYISLFYRTNKTEFLEKSITTSKRAITKAGNGYRSRLNLAFAYYLKRDYTNALKTYKEAEEKSTSSDPRGDTWFSLKYNKLSVIEELLKTQMVLGPHRERLKSEARDTLNSLTKLVNDRFNEEEQKVTIEKIMKISREIDLL